MKIQFEHNAQTYALDLVLNGKTATIAIDGKTYTAEIIRNENGNINLRVSDLPRALQRGSSVVSSASSAALSDVRFSVSSVVSSVSSDGPKRWVTVNGQTWALTKLDSGRKSSGHGAHATGELVAPMPGQVRAVQVAEGDVVTKGQTLVIVEAMKMEIKVAAPREGRVKSLKVRQGQTVEREQILAEIE